MPSKKIVTIFLASSIDEFKDARRELGDFIRDINDRFEDAFDISVRLVKCEFFDNGVEARRKQEEYNDLIRGSDMAFFLFFTRAGEYTLEEFEVALEHFNQEHKPRIYTYFKVLPEDGPAEQSLRDFMTKLESELGHYYSFFDHIDTVKLRILLQLQLQELGSVPLGMDNGRVTLGGAPCFDARQVDFIARNEDLNRVKQDLNEVRGAYYEAMEKGLAGSIVSAFADRKEALEKQLGDIEQIILDISRGMFEAGEGGLVDARLKAAYRAFERGDMKLIRQIIDEKQIHLELQQEKQKLENLWEESQCKVKTLLLKIEALKASGDSERFGDIEAIYDILLEDISELHLCEHYPENHDIWFDYAQFLDDQNKTQKAYETAKQLETLYRASISDVDGDQKAALCNLLAIIHMERNQYSEVENYFLQSIEIREWLVKSSPDRFTPDLAVSYNNGGNFYSDQGQPGKAEGYYLQAIDILRRLAKSNPTRFEPDLAASCNNAGVFYDKQNQPDKAKDYYLQAIDILKGLAKSKPDRFEPDLAMCYNSAGVFYDKQGQPEKAEYYYLQAIDIRKRLAKNNPERFEPDLAASYNSTGNFYSNQNRPFKAEGYYLHAIEILIRLAKSNPIRFQPDLAAICNNAGVFYGKQNQPDKAEDYFLQAIDILKGLAKNNPIRFEPDLAASCNNAGVFYGKQSQLDKAESYYLQAIEILKRLTKSNPDRFEPDFADSCNNAGNFFCIQNQPHKAKGYYNKALEILIRLSKSNPDRFEPDYADSCNNVGNFYSNQNRPGKAECYYLKAIEIRERLAKSNPDRFEPDLAASYDNLSIFYCNQNRPGKAECYYLKAIEIRERLAKSNPDRFEPDLAVTYYNYYLDSADDAARPKALRYAKKHPNNPVCARIIEMISRRE